MAKISERTVAFHEAGHAVASLALKRHFKYVTIVPDGEGTLGEVTHWPLRKSFQPDQRITAHDRDLINDHVSIFYAGTLAEKRATGRYNHRSADYDRGQALDLAAYVGGTGRVLRAYVEWRRLAADAIVNGCWSQIERVAEALIVRKRLTQKQMESVLFGELRLRGGAQ